jgi:deoxyribonuclease V
MRIEQVHNWQVTPGEAKAIQLKMADKVVRNGNVLDPRLIAGVDVSVNRWEKQGRAAVVILSYPSLDIVEIQVIEDKITFPYVPGLLSFREIPLQLKAFEKLKNVPGLVIVDGQGMAHPRRIGLASHLGLCLNIPTIGCAKSRLCGEHEEPALERGSFTKLMDNGEIIGAVLRTRTGVKPLYISTGHMVSLKPAADWVMSCCRGYRLPEPTRLAHMAARGFLKVNDNAKIVKAGRFKE